MGQHKPVSKEILMGQHKHPNDPNKRPTTKATKRPTNYISYGRIQYKPNSLAARIMNGKPIDDKKAGN